jgi:hypothetical protein
MAASSSTSDGIGRTRGGRKLIAVVYADIVPDGTDVHGDVNVAARLQAECPPAGICVTQAVRDHVRDQLDVAFEALGPLKLTNIARPVAAFVLRLGPSCAEGGSRAGIDAGPKARKAAFCRCGCVTVGRQAGSRAPPRLRSGSLPFSPPCVCRRPGVMVSRGVCP